MQVGAGSSQYPSWNYAEFRVQYPSLQPHLCMAGIYVRLLLEGADTGGGGGGQEGQGLTSAKGEEGRGGLNPAGQHLMD